MDGTGFRPRACRPYRAKTKGKVERPIRYVRGNFVYGRDFVSDDHLADELALWLERANARVHGTTREVPHARFERDERGVLLPLATRPYRSHLVAKSGEVARSATSDLRTASTPRPTGVATPGVPRLIEVEKRPLSVYAAVAGGTR